MLPFGIFTYIFLLFVKIEIHKTNRALVSKPRGPTKKVVLFFAFFFPPPTQGNYFTESVETLEMNVIWVLPFRLGSFGIFNF